MPRLHLLALLPLALTTAAHTQPAAPEEIHVDEHCRVYAQSRPSASGAYAKPHFQSDPNLCRMRFEHHSSHWEQTLSDGVVNRTKVQIRERQYYLYNPTSATVVFVMDQSLPDGWTIDSTPQPNLVEDHIATFRLYVRPYETINVHIGQRH